MSQRLVPIQRSLSNPFGQMGQMSLWEPPSWNSPAWPATPVTPGGGEMAVWTDFTSHWKQMEIQMREMEMRMSQMFKQYEQMMPFDWQREDWFTKNPIQQTKEGRKEFKLEFDVRQFKPEEIVIKTKDNTLSVHAKHEEKSENGHVYREYSRAFTLPHEVPGDNLKSVLSPDGLLTITAPLQNAIAAEKIIPIEHS